MKEERIVSKVVKIGERGQIVIPKYIRNREGMKPRSIVRITNYGTGNIIISKVFEGKSPEDKILELIEDIRLPKNAWEQIQKERHSER